MKIKLLRLNEKNRYLHIYNRFYCQKNIIPIGSDCHAAYILNALNLRKQSIVFDWLFCNSKKGVEYVNKMIETNFSDFLCNLTKNERQHIISENYPYVEFFHEKNLIDSSTDRNKMSKRGKRFLEAIEKESCILLYVANYEFFKKESDTDYFIETLHQLNILTKNAHSIKIFIKCNQNVNNFEQINYFVNSCNELKNVKAVKYFLDTQKYGAWGNVKDYIPLLTALEIPVKKHFLPKVFIK
ncbi:DUF1796 family putative cysteine peptidase [Weeksella virosa]|uniref:Papain-like cysteine peptidase (DUF1796) n=1 Tax=Weeksella virosa (strain ATCC 43766 / DSM 16922 / JCM 21250 / CCUG 30538 / CDC 9751 / IAM 14551 / NBRC 16016 / NCTC 11634 / CL345/78) TaxID=865938 RepID=F0P1S7_WEEVC|nr:DUF1796 family putative cysteine peptidase [Weeksella virosa]ADX68724.1 Protein of unknown function DUF1796 putative papain-like cysteine peptidase [Weeksella virosa DSM 16922]VEH63605.1 Putative papain-like cysteine peptidase (DUF1796) [Weeksella virosa]